MSDNSPRETPKGFHSAAVTETGEKGRIRAKSFANRYGQARQFYLSQSAHEQAHVASALVFEFSKVEHLRIREAMIGHLRHIEEYLAQRVVAGLGSTNCPTRPRPQRPCRRWNLRLHCRSSAR